MFSFPCVITSLIRVEDVFKVSDISMINKVKRKRGRPIGGKHPAVLRDYWRTKKQLSVAAKKFREDTHFIKTTKERHS